jgi:hypothetical protein
MSVLIQVYTNFFAAGGWGTKRTQTSKRKILGLDGGLTDFVVEGHVRMM